MNREIRETKEAYQAQVDMAKHRGLDWGFTYDTWCDLWERSGKWLERGKKSYQYCMGRIKDQGGYSPNNVNIITVKENYQEMVNANGNPIDYSHTSKTRETYAYFVYDGLVFEKQDILKEYIGCSHTWLHQLIKDKVVQKWKKQKPQKQYVTPYGTFKKSGEANEAVRNAENNQNLTRHAISARYKNDNYPDFYTEVITPPDIRLN